jgi:osmotically-inducible protein OsmY
MVDVNGVKVRRGFTTYNGKVMTFAAAERAKQLAAALAGDFPESSDLLGGGQVSGNPADTGFATGNPADEGYTGGAGPG